MERREFLKYSGLAGSGLVFSRGPMFARSVDAHIEIIADEPRGNISPYLYGQFAEHIGGVIYDGVWVGPNSKISNRYGIRAELIDMLKKIRVPVIRWPGGCFADSYDWMDGVGPAAQRPKRTNFWEVDPDAARLHENGKQIFEPNSFGTNEFVQFCKLIGAEPYLAVNLRGLPPISFDRWVEYCNSPTGSTTLAQMRAAAGFPEPFGVRFWGVGNESWGCGGDFTPEEYASEFRRYTAWLPRYGLDLQLIGSGPNGDDPDWTHRVFEELYSGHKYDSSSFTGWSVHYYASDLSRGKRGEGNQTKGDALAFDAVDWYELMRQSDRMGRIINDQWTVMGQYDREHRVKLVVDEYGPWYREGTELDPTHIFGQQITIRDALATALTLDTFNRNAEKLCLATNAQLVNNLNALFLAHGDRFIATPNYHVFGMYSAHQGGESLRVDFSAPNLHYERDGQPASFWGLNGSASRTGKVITLTVVNPELNAPKEVQIVTHGMSIIRASGTSLSADDMHAHNTFDRPDAVSPRRLQLAIADGMTTANLPPGSVNSVQMLVG